MTTILIVSKLGGIKEMKVKDLDRNILHKKCNFKNNKNFSKQTTWEVKINDEKINIELWGKQNGRAGSENKYDFPPPVDNTLLFGNCAIIRIDEEGNIIDLKKNIWKKIYEKLFGGFDDLNDEEDSEDELENVPKEMKTKEGYLLDGFIVNDANTDSDSDVDNTIITNDDDDDSDDNIDDEDDEEEDDEEEDDEEEDDEDDEDDEDEDEDEDSDYTDSDDAIGSELSEEDYEYSDDE